MDADCPNIIAIPFLWRWISRQDTYKMGYPAFTYFLGIFCRSNFVCGQTEMQLGHLGIWICGYSLVYVRCLKDIKTPDFSTPCFNLSTPDFSTMNFWTMGMKSLWLKSLGHNFRKSTELILYHVLTVRLREQPSKLAFLVAVIMIGLSLATLWYIH